MKITTNVPALRAANSANMASKISGRLSARLSTGMRISSAKDDPPGKATSTRLQYQIDGAKMASQNTMNGISVLQTAEAGIIEAHAILQRMRELAVKSANDTHTGNDVESGSDREKIQIEINKLREEIDAIAQKTDYNQIKLLNGSAGLTAKSNTAGVDVISMSDSIVSGTYAVSIDSATNAVTVTPAGILVNPKVSSVITVEPPAVPTTINRITITDMWNKEIVIEFEGDPPLPAALTANFSVTDHRLVFQTGPNKDINVEVSIGEISARSLGLDILDYETVGGATAAIKALDLAISRCSEIRGKLGAFQNRFEMIHSGLETIDLALQTSRSKIHDTDMAYDLSEMMRQQVINQASLAVLGQANQRPQSVLQLFR